MIIPFDTFRILQPKLWRRSPHEMGWNVSNCLIALDNLFTFLIPSDRGSNPGKGWFLSLNKKESDRVLQTKQNLRSSRSDFNSVTHGHNKDYAWIGVQREYDVHPRQLSFIFLEWQPWSFLCRDVGFLSYHRTVSWAVNLPKILRRIRHLMSWK